MNNTHKDNVKAINSCLSSYSKLNILAAWGETIKIRDYLKQCLIDIQDSISKYNINWLQIGSLTGTGHPRHPSRAAYDLGLKDLDINQYISKLK